MRNKLYAGLLVILIILVAGIGIAPSQTLIKRLISVTDINFATGGTGAAETFTYTTPDSLTLTLTKPDASHLKFRTAQDLAAKSVEALVDGTKTIHLKPKDIDTGAITSTSVTTGTLTADTFTDIITKSPWIDARWYGTAGTQAAIEAAVAAAIAGNIKNVYLAPGTWNLTSTNASLHPATITFTHESGAVLNMANGVTYTPNGPVKADNRKIYSWAGTGKVVWATNQPLNGLWHGATGLGVADDLAALQASIQAIKDGGKYNYVDIPNGTYYLSAALQHKMYVSLRLAPNAVLSIPTSIDGALKSSETTYSDTGGWFDIITGGIIDASANANNFAMIDLTHRYYRAGIREVTFLGNPAALQHAIKHTQTTAIYWYQGKIQHNYFSNCNAVEGAIYGASDGNNHWHGVTVEHNTWFGTFQRAGTVESGKNWRIQANHYNDGVQSPIDATGATGGLNPWWVFGKQGITWSNSDIIIGDGEWFEGGSTKTFLMYFGSNSTETGGVVKNSRLLTNKNQVWDINSTSGYAATRTAADTVTIAANVATYYKTGYLVYFKIGSNWYSSTCASDSVWGGAVTTIVINDALVTDNPTYFAAAYSSGQRAARCTFEKSNQLVKGELRGDIMSVGTTYTESMMCKTTDASGTPLWSRTLEEGYSYLVEAKVVAWQTGGAAGTIGDSGVYARIAGCKRLVGGTAAMVGVVNTTTWVHTGEDVAFGAITINPSGNNIRVIVTGAVNKNITWKGTITYTKSGN